MIEIYIFKKKEGRKEMLSVFMNRNKTIVSGLAWCTKEMSDKKVHLFHDCKIDNENMNTEWIRVLPLI